MPAQVKPKWLARLRAIDPQADLRFNTLLERWELLLTRADGVLQSQFWGWFYRQHLDGRRERITPDPVTGLYPYRDLDDAAIEEMARNLEQSFIGNRWDGVASTQAEVQRRMDFNAEKRRRFYKDAGELWADMYFDRLPKIQGVQQVAVAVELVDQHGRSLKERTHEAERDGVDGPAAHDRGGIPRRDRHQVRQLAARHTRVARGRGNGAPQRARAQPGTRRVPASPPARADDGGTPTRERRPARAVTEEG